METDRSITEVLQDIAANVQQIIRSELLLAKTEVRQEAIQTVRAGRPLIGGGIAGMYAVGFLLLCCVFALEIVVAAWAAALIVGGGVGIIGAVLVKVGLNRLRQVSPTPERTVATVKENVKWAKTKLP
jgi:hypothetical protein